MHEVADRVLGMTRRVQSLDPDRLADAERVAVTGRLGFGLAFLAADNSASGVFLEDPVVAAGMVPVAATGSVWIRNYNPCTSTDHLHTRKRVSDVLVSVDDSLKVDTPILDPLFEHRKNLSRMCRIDDEGVLGIVIDHPGLIRHSRSDVCPDFEGRRTNKRNCHWIRSLH